jgi:hypothetical protein
MGKSSELSIFFYSRPVKNGQQEELIPYNTLFLLE